MRTREAMTGDATPRPMTGGCQCGRVRYAVQIRNDEAYQCHCNMCKRATGGVAAAFKSVEAAGIAWIATAPDWYRSSSIAERPFCASCGTPLGFRYLDGSANMDLTVGSFDEPAFFRPTRNFSIETQITQWSDTSHLPGTRLDEYQPLIDRWKAAGNDTE